jgi:hypothetical protein
MSVVAVSQHNKNPTESISPVQSGHNYHLIEGESGVKHHKPYNSVLIFIQGKDINGSCNCLSQN